MMVGELRDCLCSTIPFVIAKEKTREETVLTLPVLAVDFAAAGFW